MLIWQLTHIFFHLCLFEIQGFVTPLHNAYDDSSVQSVLKQEEVESTVASRQILRDKAGEDFFFFFFSNKVWSFIRFD